MSFLRETMLSSEMLVLPSETPPVSVWESFTLSEKTKISIDVHSTIHLRPSHSLTIVTHPTICLHSPCCFSLSTCEVVCPKDRPFCLSLLMKWQSSLLRTRFWILFDCLIVTVSFFFVMGFRLPHLPAFLYLTAGYPSLARLGFKLISLAWIQGYFYVIKRLAIYLNFLTCPCDS